ncbi:MAG TPA: efflux RND transporter periplasmic adaptor subunit, partial [Chloroflexia bacterium]|nr:efflux RND transporter periplasmic adaptor subunit [Chloroflexia bacterium]
QSALDKLKAGPTAQDIAAAQAAVDQAQAGLDKARNGGGTQDVAAAQAAVDQAQAALNKLQNGAGPADLAAAQAGVDQAQAQLNKLQAGPTEQDIAAAQAVVDQAQARLRKLQAGPTAQDLAAAQASVDRAKAALDETRAGPRPEALREAQAAVEQAQANLDKVKRGATGADVAQAEARVAAAQSALDLKKQGPTATEIRILEQQVQLARYGVDNATAALADARLRAPFAGTVLTIDPKEGELVNGGQGIMQMAGLNTLRARADIDELDVGRVQPGQVVTVTLDAYPGEKMPGVIDTLAPGATEKQGSTVYKATVVFTATGEVVPRTGMAANLLITAHQKQDVLLVPNRSLETIGSKQFITIVDGDQQRKQEVETGLSNADNTEIVDNGTLKPGQTVLVR